MPERFDDICDVPGILVGHDTLADAATGCTVILCQSPALGAVDVRGGAPATRETDLLSPFCMMREVHAITLSGGSAFGLETASGVARALEERGVGFDVGVTRVPIVPAASLFDLDIGSSMVRPDAASGIRALEAAKGGPIAQGSVGAGTGATAGKMGGPGLRVKGGLGSASETLPDGHIVGAIVAVNAVGDIHDPATGAIVAGARHPSGAGWLNAVAQSVTPPASPFAGGNTTIGVIATDAPLSKAGLAKVAQMAHDGYARAIRPVHTPFDGDTIFALSTADTADTEAAGNEAFLLGLVGALAARAMERAIVKAVKAATTLGDVPAIRDLEWAR